MARIKYIGPGEIRIPGVGLITDEFRDCSQTIAEEFEDEAGFVVDFDRIAEGPIENISDIRVNGSPVNPPKTQNPKLKTDSDGGDA